MLSKNYMAAPHDNRVGEHSRFAVGCCALKKLLQISYGNVTDIFSCSADCMCVCPSMRYETSLDSLPVQRISYLFVPNPHISKVSSVVPVPSGGLIRHLVLCICRAGTSVHNFCAVFTTRTLHLC
jgi:hypothetical protein